HIAEIDRQALISHPEMQYTKQQSEVATAITKVEKSKLLPALNLGYNLMGMRGMGPDDKSYSSTPQFHSARLGLDIPIFTSSQKAKINAARINEIILNNEYERKLQNFENSYHSA